jgi:hypothetical protein
MTWMRSPMLSVYWGQLHFAGILHNHRRPLVHGRRRLNRLWRWLCLQGCGRLRHQQQKEQTQTRGAASR